MPVRPLQDRVVVELEPEKGKIGHIVLLGHDKVRKGTVVRVGPGKGFRDKYLPTEVEPGDRVCFMQAVMETKSEAQLNYRLEDNQALIVEGDILFVIEEGDPEVTM